MNTAIAVSERKSAAGMSRVRSWLNDRCGMTFEDHKIDSLELRLNRIVTLSLASAGSIIFSSPATTEQASRKACI